LRIFRPLPRQVTRPLSVLVLAAWAVQMAVLVRAALAASTVGMATDLARYGTSAQWRGVYSRGEKIGFVVGQTVPSGDGYEIQEDGQLMMTLLGASTPARLRTVARVDRAFALRSFSFSLDPGTGPVVVDGRVEGTRLVLDIRTSSGSRTDVRELEEPPALSLNLPRRLAAQGLVPGQKLTVPVFDPATLRNAPLEIDVQAREVVQAAGRPVPAFKIAMRFGGIQSTSWVTDTGEVVREESPLGFLIVKETRERALNVAISGQVQSDLLEAAAIAPEPAYRIHNPAAVTRMKARFENVDLAAPDAQGTGQTVRGQEVEVRISNEAPEEPLADRAPFLRPELFVESDAPEILAEARQAVGDARTDALKAERLTRYVNALLEKKPTVSLPSAREVLRTKVGDCNEHTVLYVAMARALGIPARIAVGVVYLRGAFYYHAWPEVRVDRRWLAVDPTLNQHPADATHVRFARGGLDKQTIVLSLVGRAKARILEVDVPEGSTPVLVGAPTGQRDVVIELPRREAGGGCWSRPD
jgi:hypothetical protein